MRRILPLVGLTIALCPMMASAIRTGEIRVFSALNQPLRAEIPIRDARGISPVDMQAILASSAAFAEVGMDRPFYLTRLRFEIKSSAKGQPVIAVTTKEAMLEPFLHFLIDFSWSDHHALREYTILLDPLETLGGLAPGAAAVSTHRYGPVKSMDTLWGIAEKSRSPNQSTEQAMQQIFDQNPGAFLKRDKNLIKAGAYLEIPSQHVALASNVSNGADASENTSTEDNNTETAALSPEARIPSMHVKTALPNGLNLPSHSGVESNIPSAVYQDKNAHSAELSLVSTDLQTEKEKNQQLQKQLEELNEQNQQLKQSIVEKDALILQAENIAQTKVTGQPITVEKPKPIPSEKKSTVSATEKASTSSRSGLMWLWVIGGLTAIAGTAIYGWRRRNEILSRSPKTMDLIMPVLKPTSASTPPKANANAATSEQVIEESMKLSQQNVSEVTEPTEDATSTFLNSTEHTVQEIAQESFSQEISVLPDVSIPTETEDDHVLAFTPTPIEKIGPAATVVKKENVEAQTDSAEADEFTLDFHLDTPSAVPLQSTVVEINENNHELNIDKTENDLVNEFNFETIEADAPLEENSLKESDSQESVDYQSLLDLAQAYIEIADYDGAAELLKDIAANADPSLQAKARALIAELPNR